MPIIISGSTGISGVDGTVATPAVQGADTNTGVYYPAADQVALSTNGVQAMLATTTGTTVAGNLSFNSGYGSAAVAYGCRAWVNFNGTGTVAIRASGNVTSITDNGTGDYTVNFTTAMPDVNYGFSISAGRYAATAPVPTGGRTTQPTTSSMRIYTTTTDGTAGLDCEQVSFSVFR